MRAAAFLIERVILIWGLSVLVVKPMGGQRSYQVLQGTGVSKTFHFFLFLAQQPPVGQGLIHEASRSHTPQSVGLLWTSNYLVAETST